MNLHDDVFFRIFARESKKNFCLIFLGLFPGQGFALRGLQENAVRLLIGAFAIRNIVNPVIGSTAAMGFEIIDAFVKRRDDLTHLRDSGAACHIREPRDVFRKAGPLDIDCFVRAETRADQEAKIFLGRKLFMPFKTVRWVVCRSNIRDPALTYNAADRKIRVILEHMACLFPDLFRILYRKRFSDAEILVKLEIAPVIHRIADGHLQSLRKCGEFLVRVG